MPAVGVVLDPRLGLRAEDVVRTWNNDPDGRRAGAASIPDVHEARDFSPAADAVQIVIDLVVGIGGAGLYDMIKIVIGRLRAGSTDVEVVELDAGNDDRPVLGVTERADTPR